MGEGERRRAALALRGRLQGVGCRPAIARLASSLALAGFVRNGKRGVEVEIEGRAEDLEAFVAALPSVLRSPARLDALEREERSPLGEASFAIAASEEVGSGLPSLLPDAAPCASCLRELFDPHDRRHRYPFTSCAACGPRFSIATRLPFDREATTMIDFPPCAACAGEYGDPDDRRFHAQTISCPHCGPRLSLVSMDGEVLEEGENAIREAAHGLAEGLVLGVKGVGGYQLLVDAENEEAVRRLRERKHRPWKPLALMVRTLEDARRLVRLPEAGARALGDAGAPIVLADREPSAIAASVAPDLPTLGVMLPSSPLHHLLLSAFDGPVVCTSGNRSGAPIVLDEHDAFVELAGIADRLLVHDRRIERRLDDSVVQLVGDELQVLRRGRGLAPSVLDVGVHLGRRLAVGGDGKNAFALAIGREVLLSAHHGNLEHASVFDAFANDLAMEPGLHGVAVEHVVRDLHPDQASHRHAATLGPPCISVPHHAAHVAAVMAEHRLEPPLLGVAFDGFGLGEDGTLRGGECFVVTHAGIQRTHRLRPFPLPGGDRAALEPRRSYLGLLFETLGPSAFEHPSIVGRFDATERMLLRRMLERDVGAPRTSSVGRLFDGIASLLELRQRSRFEGDAAMQVQFTAESEAGDASPYPFVVADGELDFRPMLVAMLEAKARGERSPALARRFHATMAAMVAEVARETGMARVALGGGCFQNRLLVGACRAALAAQGGATFVPREVPANDGGLAVGQLLASGLPGWPFAIPPRSGQD